MFFPSLLTVSWILGNCGLSFASHDSHDHMVYDSCRGNKQSIVIPEDYDKDMPDTFLAENITQVQFDYRIQRLRGVNEER